MASKNPAFSSSPCVAGYAEQGCVGLNNSRNAPKSPIAKLGNELWVFSEGPFVGFFYELVLENEANSCGHDECDR